ncbi:LysR substrate-binding domain-containing protein [Gammaproteobacteria bacterium]|nr:LysR substrate-binding domain-containing protein [Gammaproteobacteria bacterium]
MPKTAPANWFRTFLVVSQRGSFSAATDELHLTQAAISKQIRLLEHHYGRALFDRHGRGVRLNAAGQQVLPRVEQAFALLDEAGGTRIDKADEPLITVRGDLTWIATRLAPTIPKFARSHPEIRLQLSSYVWDDEIGNSDADLWIRYGSGDWPGLHSERLADEFSLVVATPGLARQPIESLLKHTWMTVIGQEQWLLRWLVASDVPTASTPRCLTFDNSVTIKAALAGGEGVALMRHSLVKRELESGALAAVGDQSVHYNECYYRCRPRDGEWNDRLQCVWDWIGGEAEKSN